MKNLFVPLMLVLISIFLEVWYLNEEMLVVASSLVFMTLCVAQVSDLLADTLAQDANALDKNLLSYESKGQQKISFLGKVWKDVTLIPDLALNIFAFKAETCDLMENHTGFLTIQADVVAQVSKNVSEIEAMWLAAREKEIRLLPEEVFSTSEILMDTELEDLVTVEEELLIADELQIESSLESVVQIREALEAERPENEIPATAELYATIRSLKDHFIEEEEEEAPRQSDSEPKEEGEFVPKEEELLFKTEDTHSSATPERIPMRPWLRKDYAPDPDDGFDWGPEERALFEKLFGDKFPLEDDLAAIESNKDNTTKDTAKEKASTN